MALSFHDFILLPQFCVCVHVCDFLLQKRTSRNQKISQMNFVVLEECWFNPWKGFNSLKNVAWLYFRVQ